MAAASPRPREATPPPVIGKAGRYTVFITPRSTPYPVAGQSPLKASPLSPVPAPAPDSAPPTPVVAPPVQVPPLQFEKAKVGGKGAASGSVLGFFWNAVARVQDAHSSLDEYLAELFGLDQSKYQWALDDYYEINGKEKGDGKSSRKEQIPGKEQSA